MTKQCWLIFSLEGSNNSGQLRKEQHAHLRALLHRYKMELVYRCISASHSEDQWSVGEGEETKLKSHQLSYTTPSIKVKTQAETPTRSDALRGGISVLSLSAFLKSSHSGLR